MIALKSLQAIIGLLTLLLAYIITITPAGYFRAWMAKKMGDETAEELGFLTFNPLMHIDFVGLVCLLLFSQPEYFMGFGWGAYVPVNPNNIHGRRRWLKLACAFFSTALLHFVMATVALTCFVLLFGSPTKVMMTPSSFYVAVGQLMVAFVTLNAWLVLMQLTINAVVLGAFYIADGSMQFSSYVYYVMWLAPLLILLLFGNELYQLIIHGIVGIQHMIASR